MVVAATVWLLVVVAAIFVLTMTFNEIPLLLLGVFVHSLGFEDRPVEPSWAAVGTSWRVERLWV